VVEGCCSASGARALHLVWEHGAAREADELHVHLGLTRETPWAGVVNHEPVQGRLDVRLREALRLRLRAPSWLPPEQAALTVDGAQRPLVLEGPYVVLDSLPAGSQVSLHYPLTERVEGFTVDEKTTLAYWRGGLVIDVLPDEGPAPIYQHRVGDEPLADWSLESDASDSARPRAVPRAGD
jgi:hypothetical protein